MKHHRPKGSGLTFGRWQAPPRAHTSARQERAERREREVTRTGADMPERGQVTAAVISLPTSSHGSRGNGPEVTGRKDVRTR